MIWQAFLYILVLLVSLILLLTSRYLVTIRRWYDFSFLQGVAFFCWGLGHLFSLHDDPLYQIGSTVLLYLFYLFFFLAFRAFPLSPHLYFDRWKTYLDAVLLTVIYTSLSICILVNPAKRDWYDLLIHLQTGLFLSVTGLLMIAAHRRRSVWGRHNGGLFASILFLLVDSLTYLLPDWLGFFLMTGTLGGLLYYQLTTAETAPQVEVQEEYVYFQQKLQFSLRDETVGSLLIVLSVLAMMMTPDADIAYEVGMGCFVVLMLVRWLLSIRSNNQIANELFVISRNLEKHFADNLREKYSKNEKLSHLLTVKQRYEKLLVASNEHNMRTIHYENLHKMIEEIVNVWYDTLTGITFLRVSLQSETGTSYYEVVRSENGFLVDPSYMTVTVRLTVSENADTLLSPRYVVVEAVKDLPAVSKEEKPFFDLLAIHVRGLIQRCLQNQQSMEIRLMEQEMELASKIQFTLIPRERLSLPYAEAKAVYIPAAYVGGDYVDYLAVDNRYSCYLVADISGHGLPASLLTTGIRSAFRAVIQTCISPDEILSRLNRLLYEDLSRTRSFVTMCLVVLDQEAGVLRMSRAGHPAPIYLSKTRQTVLECGRGVGLGLYEDAAYPLDEWRIEEDGMLLIYTDGLTDLGRKKNALTLQDWLHQLASAKTQAGEHFDSIAAVEQNIWRQARQLEQQDDISVLILDLKQRFIFEKGENDVVSMRSMS
ncbi:serine/threonine-protein phosphatase [Brevibacillus humidisoli]|uniref:PP2C family protein-serine/threonine phosphatase n=1 Tax=Brevibacillus humidisoli TaxID=2895522 RepID=UPI001E4D06C0|nr:PP2C family protein-serine/threonine phosphatase [Brevibacillus humidisoli]UFJ39065.1 serine/threonine-protein phosphatase [Brevibacillus humidisoli]